MNNSETNNQSKAEDDSCVILVAMGSFVAKSELREKINLQSQKIWFRQIHLIRERKESFAERYEPYYYRNFVTVDLAKEIVRFVEGDEIEIKIQRR